MTTAGQLLTVCARHLLEDAGFSTGLWSASELITYMNDTQNEFMIRTGIVKDCGMVRGLASQGEYQDPAYALDVERISYNGKKLYPQTQQELSWQRPTWSQETARNPRRYHRDALGAHRFRVWPTPTTEGFGYSTSSSHGIPATLNSSPSVTGTRGIPCSWTSPSANYMIGSQPHTSNGAGTIAQLMTGSLNFFVVHDALPKELVTVNDELTVTDAFSRYIVYGTLHRAWAKEGDGQDIPRSNYSKARFERGVQLAQRLVYGEGASWQN